jgi:hypothetical protein
VKLINYFITRALILVIITSCASTPKEDALDWLMYTDPEERCAAIAGPFPNGYKIICRGKEK